MYKTSSSLEHKTIKIAEEMIKTGETIMPVPFRHAKNCVFISTDIDAVFALNYISVEGVDFFIGHKRKNENSD